MYAIVESKKDTAMIRRNFDKPNQMKVKKRNKTDYHSSIITERFLTMFLRVVSSTNTLERIVLQKYLKFMQQIPQEKYERQVSVYGLLNAIIMVIKNKLEGINDKEELIEIVNLEMNIENYDEVKENIIFPSILSSDEISDKEVNLVRKTVDSFLRYSAILENKDNLSDILTDIGSGNISNLDSALTELKDVINLLYDEFKKTEVSDSGITITHTYDYALFSENLKRSHEHASSPRMVLHTGLKTLNDMLSYQGGFLGGKWYQFYADTNNFKSALLKYIEKWIQKYNNENFREEFLATGKRPTVLKISLEDGMLEDISRSFTSYTERDLMSIDDYAEVERLWKAAYDPEHTIIDITQVNCSENSMNLSAVKSIIKNLEEQGYFIIALIIDSFDLMAPEDEDIYRGITDDLTLFSNRAKALQKFIADKPYPLITAHQLNRAGNQAIAEKKDKGVVDIAKALGRSFISGAYDIERRVHWSAFICIEWSKYDNEQYLEIKRDKVKYKKTNTDYLAQQLKNGFIIEDDYGTDRVGSRSSIIPSDNDHMYSQGASSLGTRGVSSIAQMNRELGIKTPPPQAEKDGPLFSGSTGTASTAGGMIYGHIGDLSYSKWVNPFDIAEEKNLVPDVWVSPFDN
jgi:hypothetical protein